MKRILCLCVATSFLLLGLWFARNRQLVGEYINLPAVQEWFKQHAEEHIRAY